MKTLARAQDKDELLRRLRRLRPDSERRWGRMTAHQVVCHMSDAVRMAIGQRAVTHDSGPLRRTVVKWVALYAPLHWPPGIPTSPELDQQGGGTQAIEFAADLAQLEALLELFAACRAADTCPQHPTFGRMSLAAWLRWGYLHTDHHLRQFGA